MWKKKKFIIGLLVAVLIIGASLGGTALANGNDEDSQSDTLLARVAEILGIDQQRVEEAFSQAQSELREERLDGYLQNLIDEGIITEDQAIEYKNWLESKPNMEEYRNQIRQWFESRPDVPDNPRSKSFGFFKGMGGMKDFDELTVPCH